VRVAVDVEPGGRAALLGLDARAHALGQYLGASAGNRPLSRLPQAIEDVADGELAHHGHRLDLRRGEEVWGDLRKPPARLRDEVQIILKR